MLKEQVLSAIEMRHANEQAYQVALTDWQVVTAHPEEQPHWLQFYANALRDALCKTNNRRQETLNQMTQDDWRIAVTWEMRADLWYEEPDGDTTPVVTHSSDVGMLMGSRNGNSPKVSAATA